MQLADKLKPRCPASSQWADRRLSCRGRTNRIDNLPAAVVEATENYMEAEDALSGSGSRNRCEPASDLRRDGSTVCSHHWRKWTHAGWRVCRDRRSGSPRQWRLRDTLRTPKLSAPRSSGLRSITHHPHRRSHPVIGGDAGIAGMFTLHLHIDVTRAHVTAISR